MYSVFRECKTPLPGDPVQIKNQKPSIKILTMPYKCDDSVRILPNLESNILQVQPTMNIEAFKKYIAKKLSLGGLYITFEEILIYYKNIVMKNELSFIDIRNIYGINEDSNNSFFFCRI